MACALYLCCLIVAGYPLAAGLAHRANWQETAALALCMGPGVLGIILIFLSMFGVRPIEPEILGIAAALAVAGIIVWRWGPRREPILAREVWPPMWWRLVCFAGIGYGLFAVGKDVLINPVIEWDAFAIWQLKGLVLAILPLHPRPGYFSDLSLSFSHLRYPLLVPMVSAGMHAMTGSLDDYGKLVALLWYPGMGLAVFATVWRLNGPTAALTSTAMLACAAPITHFGGSGTAEMALTAFYACSVLCIVRWREMQFWGYVILAALFGAWMTWTKNEGLAMAAVNALVVAISGRNWKKNLGAAGIMIAIAAVIYLPWIFFSRGLPRTDEDYAGRLNLHQVISDLPNLGAVLAGFGLELINWKDWGLFWIIAAVLAFIERRRFRNGTVLMLAALVVLQLLAYVPPMMVTSWKLKDLLPVTIGRLFMHAAPAGAILIGALWPAWLGGTSADHTTHTASPSTRSG